MTSKIEGGKGVGPVQEMQRTRKVASGRAEDNRPGTDRVEFSAVLQEVSRARQAAASPEAVRAEKVRTLKEQVAAGSYRPDLEKVAESLLRFMAESKRS